MKQHKDGKHFGSMNSARSELLTHRRANFKRTNLHLADAGVDDVACLTSPPDSSVQYGDIKILNLHFHANSEHTQRGQQNFLLSVSYSILPFCIAVLAPVGGGRYKY